MGGTSESLREALIAFRQVELPPISGALNQVTVTSKVTVTFKVYTNPQSEVQSPHHNYHLPITNPLT